MKNDKNRSNKKLNDEFEKEIYKYFKENKKAPDNISKAIEEVDLSKAGEINAKEGYSANRTKRAYEKIAKSNIRNKIGKVMVTTLSIITVSGGVAFATGYLKNRFDDHRGVSKAIESGYDYQTAEKKLDLQTLQDANNKLQITDIIMDDYMLDMDLLIDLDKTIDINGLENTELKGLIISDENNNVLGALPTSDINGFLQSKGIEPTQENYDNKVKNVSISSYLKDSYTEPLNKLNIAIRIKSDETNPLPKSKKIFVKIDAIEFKGYNIGKALEIQGNWENKLTVPSTFVNRKAQLYKLTSVNNDKVDRDQVKGELYSTGFKFSMSMNYGNYETVSNELDARRRKNVLEGALIRQDKSYAENEKGEKFYPTKSSDSDGGYSFTTDGMLKAHETFDITQFDSNQKIKVVLTTYTDEQLIFEFER